MRLFRALVVSMALAVIAGGVHGLYAADFSAADIAKMKQRIASGSELSARDLAEAREMQAQGSEMPFGAFPLKARGPLDRGHRGTLDDYLWAETAIGWEDITETGTNTGLTNDDQTVGPFDLGFNFNYFGQDYDQVWICSNGWIAFVDNFSARYWNGNLPDVEAPNTGLYPFFDDLYLPISGEVYYKQDGNRFIVSWVEISHIAQIGTYTFQVIFDSDGVILFQYEQIDGDATQCSIGIDNQDGTEGIEICANGAGTVPATGDAYYIVDENNLPGGATVSGHVTLDGGNGTITQVNVRANGLASPSDLCDGAGNYVINDVQTGNRRITASLNGYISNWQDIVLTDGGATNVNITIRRNNPPAPTNLTASVNSNTGEVTLDWDNSADPLVDEYRLYRKLEEEDVWVQVGTFTQSNGTNTLTSNGIWEYAVTAADLNVSTPAVSDYSRSATVLYGELPPSNLHANGRFDDHIHLFWLPPGVQPAFQIFYDDSSSETWYRVANPNGGDDWFAVRFTPPSSDSVNYPLPIQTANIYMEREDPLPNVVICPSTAEGYPDIPNAWATYQNVGADASPGWLVVHPDGEIVLEDDSDFWVAWQFPPGIIGPGTGSDASAPDNRSYWTQQSQGAWNQWFSNDWMARVWVGGAPGGAPGFVMSVGAPSGYSVEQIPSGTTFQAAPPLPGGNGVDMRGPVRDTNGNSDVAGFSQTAGLHWEIGASQQAPDLIYTVDGRNSLDDLVHYNVYREGALHASPTENFYDDPVAEGIEYHYYVTGFYDNGEESGPTATITGMAAMAPAAPSAVNGTTLNSTQLRISWTNPTINANGQPLVDFAGCRVYRDDVQIAQVASNVTEYVDTPPFPNRTYVWSVRGIDEVPNVGPAGSWTGSVVDPWTEESYDWVDITGNGEQVPLFAGQFSSTIDLGFTFNFYGQDKTELKIASYGYVTFNLSDPFPQWTGVTIPNTLLPNDGIYGFLTGFNPGAGGQVYYRSLNNEFIVSFIDVPSFMDGLPYTFQMILRENSSIVFNYQTIPSTQFCTIGIENSNGTSGIPILDWGGGGVWTPTDESSISFFGPPPVYANVSGHVTLDGGAGNVQNVLIRANGVSHPQANPNASGDYTLVDVVVGNRRFEGTLAGYNTGVLNFAVPEGGLTIDWTLRRVNPPNPTGLTGTVDNNTGATTLDWANSTDPLVDHYRVYRKRQTENTWTLSQTVAQSNAVDNLPQDDVWNFVITAIDQDVQGQPVESGYSNMITVLYGSIPPGRLSANGRFDDHVRLAWSPPGMQPSFQIAYDDSSSEAWFRVASPNGPEDYFAVRFTPPSADSAGYPLPIQVAGLYMERTDPLPDIRICPDDGTGTAPDFENPLVSWQDLGAEAEPGWLFADAEGQVFLENESDFWVCWQFPPGIIGPGTGSDQSAPDLRSYWTQNPTAFWNQWFSHDWMCRVWLGGPREQLQGGGGFLLSVGEPSGYRVESIAAGQTAPFVAPAKDAEGNPVGPVRTKGSTKVNSPTWRIEPNAYSQAPDLVFEGTRDRRSLDDLDYYKVYRNGTFLAQTTQTFYNDPRPENQPIPYHVTAHYDNGEESVPSNTVTIACNMAPGAPASIDLTPVGSTTMRISWTAPTTNADGTPLVDLAGYRIYRGDTQIGAVGSNVFQYNDQPPQANQFYTWSVKAIDEVPNIGPAASRAGAVQSPWEEIDYVWEDISQIGTPSGLSNDDQNVGPFNLGFSVEFFGQLYDQVYICSNGWVSFTSTSARYWNACLPDAEEPNAVIYGVWDDLYLPSGGEVRYYQDAGDRFIVSWLSVPHIGGAAWGNYTFQIIITSDHGIQLNYNELTGSDPTTSITVGVENESGTEALQLWCEGTGDFEPHTGSSVEFWGGPSGLMVGTVRSFPQNLALADVAVYFQEAEDTAYTRADGGYELGAEPGTYHAVFEKAGFCDSVVANVVLQDGIETPLNVSLRAPSATFSVTSLSQATWPGHDVSGTFTITNPTGNCPLSFSISDTSTWLSAIPATGQVQPGQTVEIQARMNVGGLIPGTEYHSVLIVSHNASGLRYDIPVTLFIALDANDPASVIPTEFAFHSNYPNPFNATTAFRFDVPQESRVEIVIYNVAGQEVDRPVDALYQAGRHEVSYTATNLPSGMYLVRMNAGSFSAIGKMLLLK